jgi:NAD-dependent deacetylase
VNSWLQAENECKKCELMLVVGTSLEVMPSAKLPIEALEHNSRLIIINQEATFVDVRADVVIHENAADVLPQIVSEVLNG